MGGLTAVYNAAMSRSILRRSVGTLVLLATVGLSTCQGGFYASLPGATISSPLQSDRG
jgi:hypothetical protein